MANKTHNFTNLDAFVNYHLTYGFVRTAYRITLEHQTFYLSNVGSWENWIVFALPNAAKFSFDCRKYVVQGCARQMSEFLTILDKSSQCEDKPKFAPNPPDSPF